MRAGFWQSRSEPPGKPGTSRAFASFDAMFAMVPALVMLLFALSIAHTLTGGAMERMHRQETLDKLVSIADYLVKQGAVVTERAGDGAVSRPNWIERDRIEPGLEAELERMAGLAELEISLDKPDPEGGSTCIYRLVVVDDTKEITKLYVCGE